VEGVYAKGEPARAPNARSLTDDGHAKAALYQPCQFRGCYANAKARGLPLKPRRDVCDFPRCGRKHFAFGYCRAHRAQMRKGQLVPIGLVSRCITATSSRAITALRTLRLWTSHQPKGARVADMLAWCRWFIGQYPEAPEDGYEGCALPDL
jgi:hypothetical protein